MSYLFTYNFLALFQHERGMASPIKVHVSECHIDSTAIQDLSSTAVGHLAQSHQSSLFSLLLDLEDHLAIFIWKKASFHNTISLLNGCDHHLIYLISFHD